MTKKKPGRPRKSNSLVRKPFRIVAHAGNAEPPTADGLHGGYQVAATLRVLNALAALPSDRSKHRVLRFVQDYFDEQHGH